MLFLCLELWLYVPKGYSIDHNAIQFIPLIIGYCGAMFILIPNLKPVIWSITLIAFVGTFMAIDNISENGLPTRKDPFASKVVDEINTFYQENYRIVGDDITLPPNLSSAIGIKDIRFVDTFTPSATHVFINDHLRPLPNDKDKFMDVLWFTGLPKLFPQEPIESYTERFLDRQTAYSLSGVKYLISKRFSEQIGNEILILENPNALPSVYAVQHLEFAPSPSLAMKKALRLSHRMKNTAVVENSQLLEEITTYGNQGDGNQGATSIKLLEEKTNSTLIEVQTNMANMIVINDSHFNGWEATVNGVPTPIHRINGISKGILIDQGRHMIKIQFKPKQNYLHQIQKK